MPDIAMLLNADVVNLLAVAIVLIILAVATVGLMVTRVLLRFAGAVAEGNAQMVIMSTRLADSNKLVADTNAELRSAVQANIDALKSVHDEEGRLTRVLLDVHDIAIKNRDALVGVVSSVRSLEEVRAALADLRVDLPKRIDDVLAQVTDAIKGSETRIASMIDTEPIPNFKNKEGD